MHVYVMNKNPTESSYFKGDNLYQKISVLEIFEMEIVYHDF